MKLITHLLVIGLLAACLVLVSSNDEVQHSSLQQSIESGPRAVFKLPKLFDFDRFKATFQKHYESLIEELVRQKIFLARAFQAFVSAISYKNHKKNYYLSVNQMSDWTQKDIDESKLSVDQMGDIEDLIKEKGAIVLPKPETTPTSSSQETSEVPAASLEDIERQLREIKLRKNEPGYHEIAEELESLQRQKRDLMSDPRRLLSPDDLMRSPDAVEPPEVMHKILRNGIPKNNPNYEPPELASLGIEEGTRNKINSEQAQFNYFQEVAGNFQRGAGDFFNQMLKTRNFLGQVIQDAMRPPPPKPSPGAGMTDEVRSAIAALQLSDVDHRKSNCFFQPRSQGKCGSCYAFSAIALYEWLYCKKTNNLVGFSEQFMVDCGHRAQLNGCDGGNVVKAAKFVDTFGLELRKNYPYRDRGDHCPYDNSTEPTKMGYLKLDQPGYQLIKLSHIHYFIEKAPIIVGIKLSPSFRHYGGGVDENPDCQRDDAHALLLVGSGTEDGKDFFLMRNSHSVAWGERGYWKLSKERFYECAFYNFGVMITASLGERNEVSKKRAGYMEGPVRERYNAYAQSEYLKRRNSVNS